MRLLTLCVTSTDHIRFETHNKLHILQILMLGNSDRTATSIVCQMLSYCMMYLNVVIDFTSGKKTIQVNVAFSLTSDKCQLD